MAGVRKFTTLERAEAQPPANLWEILRRGDSDTFPLHTALWLFKNAQGDTGAFRYLPGPAFAYRTREPIVPPFRKDYPDYTLVVLAWFLCLSAYGKGHLHAGRFASVYGSLSEGFLEPPVKIPSRPEELPPQVRDLLTRATFPLSELPALSLMELTCFLSVRVIKYASIFGALEGQLLKRAKLIRMGEYVPEDIEEVVQDTVDRAKGAFEMPSKQDWKYDQVHQGRFISSTRCRLVTPAPSSMPDSRQAGFADNIANDFSPYSPPYWGLPIFDLRPLWQEALRLIKLVPEKLEWCPSLPFMTSADWECCHKFRTERRFSKAKHDGFRTRYPKNSDQAAAWDWIESIYGQRVRSALFTSDRCHKSQVSSPLQIS
jgi:hypothetical protein